MKTRILLIPLCFCIVTSLSAGTIGVDPTTGTPALVSGNGGLTLGWEFEVADTNGITVDGLGFWDDQADGFLFGQTFDVGLWEPNSGTLLRSTTVTSASTLVTSVHPSGDWRVNGVSPVYLPPGLYRIGALYPVSGANGTISSDGNPQVAPGINLVRYLRQLGSATLAMPNVGSPTGGSSYFGPTFTFISGPLVLGPTNLFYFSSSPTAWVGGGQTLAFTNVAASRTGNLGVYTDSVHLTSSGYEVAIVGPNLGLPQVGYYPGAVRWPFMDAGSGLAFTSPGRGDNTLSGWFNVLQANYGTNGQPTAFAVDFVQYDETIITKWNRGSIRFNSAIPVPGPTPPISIRKFFRTNGIVQFTLAGPQDTPCVVQTSSNLTSWTPLLTNTFSPVGLIAISDSAAVGKNSRFYRAVFSSGGGGGGGGTGNDMFANRITIPSAGAVVTGSNTNATTEPGEPNHGNATGGKSLWWTWTATSSGIVSISLDGSSFDTTLGVYIGTAVNSLTSVAQDDEGGAGSCSRVVFAASAGITYQIAVDGYFGSSGNIVLTVKPGLLNDNFVDRLLLVGSFDQVVGSNIGAWYENFEPYHWQTTGEQSVWWKWTAPASGPVTISTLGSNFDTIMAAYTGTSLSGLTLMANNDDANGSTLTSQISFFATAGVTYQIAVDGYGTSSGSILVTLQQ